MEKFTTWRDPATGIHPFLPIKVTRNWSSLGIIIYHLVGVGLVLARIPLLFATISVWMILLYTFNIIMQISPPVVGTVLLRTVDIICGHFALFLLGYFYIPLRRMTFRPGAELSIGPVKTIQGEEPIQAGDVLLCNNQSPVDIIYLCTKFSPIFTIVDQETGKVGPCSRWFALFKCGWPGTIGNAHSHGHGGGIEKLVRQAHRPIVIFPEGTTGNGRALLLFSADLSKLPSNQRFHLLALKYTTGDGGFTPTFPIPGFKSLLKFFCLSCSQWYNTLTVKWIDSGSIYSNKFITTPESLDFKKRIHEVLATLLHLRSVSLTLKDKAAFLCSYNNQGQNKIKL